MYAFIVSTYTDGCPPPTFSWFCNWLEDTAHDFRVQKSLLGGMKYAVLGLGNSLYKENFGYGMWIVFVSFYGFFYVFSVVLIWVFSSFLVMIPMNLSFFCEAASIRLLYGQ